MDNRSETSQGKETDFRKREDEGRPQREPGRVDTGTKGESDRPTGKSTGRDSTGVNPEDPIDPKSPNLIGP
ncbi:MAG: hypothetical protein NVS1B14_04640 [Vulcanimicrobiaceae bacterium]